MHLRRCIWLLVRLGGPSGSGLATAVGCQTHYASYGRRQRAVANVVHNVTTGLRSQHVMVQRGWPTYIGHCGSRSVREMINSSCRAIFAARSQALGVGNRCLDYEARLSQAQESDLVRRRLHPIQDCHIHFAIYGSAQSVRESYVAIMSIVSVMRRG